jgi:hypothetical protein
LFRRIGAGYAPLVTAWTRSLVLADFERYAYELLLVACVAAEDEPALPGRVLGPSAQDVSSAVGSAITLSARPGRDRLFWLTADVGSGLLAQTRGGRPGG